MRIHTSAFRSFIALSVLVLAPALHAQDARVDAFFDRFATAWVEADPDLATGTRYFTGAKQAQLERQLTPQTRAWQIERIDLAKRGLLELSALLADPAATRMTPTQRISAELMRWQLESVVSGEPFLDYSFPIDQFGGANITLVDNLTVRHPLAVAQDADNYLARLALIDTRMDEALVEAKRLADKGWIPPRFIIEATLKQLRGFAGTPPAQNPLVTSLVQRLAPDALDAAGKERVAANAARIVGTEVYPAWNRAIALLESILPRSTNDAGLWRLPGGDAAYANALGRFTSTRMTAEEIHEVGLKQVARIEAQMESILKTLGRTQGTVKDRIDKLEIDLRYPNPDSEESRAAIMRDVDALMADSLKRSAVLFADIPKTPVVARPFPRFREANAAANYNRAPFDGSRPAVFQMPLRLQYMTKFGLRTLVYHETVPGHHFQIASEQENPNLPRFRQARALGGISALSEGWALYSERLAAENGWYDGDPEGLLGQLDAELFRARRLVVDTGLHAKRWTRQQAIDYGIEASEIERYVVYPGQATSYMVGQLKLIELRDRARRELGDKFSFKAFHSAVLGAGTVPLDLLEKIVEQHIRERAATER
jgi:uncharacterized protein (DUF885 family)